MDADPAPAKQLLALLDGYRVMQALYVCAELRVPDALSDGPLAIDELARACDADPPALSRLLRAMASLDVVEELPDRLFALKAMGNLLRSDAAGSLRAAVIFYGGRRHWTAWGGLLESVKTGNTAFGARSTTAFVEMATRDPAGAAVFNEAMAALTGPVNAAVVAVYDFSSIGTLVDVGGGYGALLAGILTAHPHLHGILFEIPPVADAARSCLAAAGVAQRCQAIGGDAFAAVPGGGDAYILKWIIHDWSDEHSTTILRNCRAVMPANGKLLLVERVIPEHVTTASDTAAKLLADLNMLLLTGGRERTEAEYRSLLAAAGFALTRIVPTATPISIIEATPI